MLAFPSKKVLIIPLERNRMEQTKIVKSKIVYPHLGIVDEIEEEIFVRKDEEGEKYESTTLQEHEGLDSRSGCKAHRL